MTFVCAYGMYVSVVYEANINAKYILYIDMQGGSRIKHTVAQIHLVYTKNCVGKYSFGLWRATAAMLQLNAYETVAMMRKMANEKNKTTNHSGIVSRLKNHYWTSKRDMLENDQNEHT